MQETYKELNAQLNLRGEDGHLQLDKDKEAVRAYFLEHVNPNTVFFHSHVEKIEYMLDNGYWDKELFEEYSFDHVRAFFAHAYHHGFRFRTFVGAYKFYSSYALKTRDGERYLERWEDRVVLTAMYLGKGTPARVFDLITMMITGVFQPATPTFLNAGRAQRGEHVSCFLLRMEDNMESITHVLGQCLQLSKRGGGVSVLLSNLREDGAPIKGLEGMASGVVPVMKILEDSFSYANQLGARNGAGAVYLNVHHPDILAFLDTKRENADEKVRIKTLSLGVVIPDITMELARDDKDMYLFSPYDIQQVYGKAFADISITEMYDELVENPKVRKTKINARKLLQTIAAVQMESGYPYIMFEDNVNRANDRGERINMSNLCSEILQPNEETTYDALTGSVHRVGVDIACNLGSLNIANMMADPDNFAENVANAVCALTVVAEKSNLAIAPGISHGNSKNHSIGLGQMNLHGYLASQGIEYGSEEALDFVNVYFALVKYHAYRASVCINQDADYWEGYGPKNPAPMDAPKWSYDKLFEEYVEQAPHPRTEKVKQLFEDVEIPDEVNWVELADDLVQTGTYNSYLLAVPPTGSISYINEATPSILPVTAPIEVRKEGKLGRVYYPAPGLTEDNVHLYKDGYQLGWKAIIDTYAEATKHTDQGLSLTLFFPDTATTRDINRAQVYAWKKGIKTLYYVRIKQQALEGTEVADCVSCTL